MTSAGTPESIASAYEAAEFNVETTMTSEEIAATAVSVAERCRRFGYHKIVDKGRLDDDDGLLFAVRVGGNTAGMFTISWQSSGQTRAVTLDVLDYSTYRTAILGIIPVGGHKSDALDAIARFSKLMQEALAA